MSETPTALPSSGLLPAKRRQILAGARQTFGELGFERASVDLVAARAGVSKATLYNHFDDKKALFIACFSEEVEEMRARVRTCLGEPGTGLVGALERAGQGLVYLAISPAVVRLYRSTVAETGRFPELGQTLFERGPRAIQDALAAFLSVWHERGDLRVDDPRTAAIQFSFLCQGDLTLRAQLGLEPTQEDVRSSVARGVHTFLRAYRR